jgi:hypothetical protein
VNPIKYPPQQHEIIRLANVSLRGDTELDRCCPSGTQSFPVRFLGRRRCFPFGTPTFGGGTARGTLECHQGLGGSQIGHDIDRALRELYPRQGCFFRTICPRGGGVHCGRHFIYHCRFEHSSIRRFHQLLCSYVFPAHSSKLIEGYLQP